MAALENGGEYVPKRILITGGAGFIASHVAIRLVTRYPQYKVATQPFSALAIRLALVPTCKAHGLSRGRASHLDLRTMGASRCATVVFARGASRQAVVNSLAHCHGCFLAGCGLLN